MKLRIAFLLAFLVFQLTGFGQVRHSKGTLLFEAFYGFPDNQAANVGEITSRNITPNSQSFGSYYIVYQQSKENVSIWSTGLFGGRLEYIISNKVGFGLLVDYDNTIATFDERVKSDVYTIPKTYCYNCDTHVSSGNAFYKGMTIQVRRIRIMPTVNVHIGRSKRFDPYFQLAIGYLNNNLKYNITNPTSTTLNDIKSSTYGDDFPFSARCAIGLRYYPVKNLGLYGEVGIGAGTFVLGGITIRTFTKIKKV